MLAHGAKDEILIDIDGDKQDLALMDISGKENGLSFRGELARSLSRDLWRFSKNHPLFL